MRDAAWVRAYLEDANPDAILWEGLDAAVIGVAYRCGMQPVVLYERSRCINALVHQWIENHPEHNDPIPEAWESAIEHFDHNVAGAFVGPHTPLIADLSENPL